MSSYWARVLPIKWGLRRPLGEEHPRQVVLAASTRRIGSNPSWPPRRPSDPAPKKAPLPLLYRFSRRSWKWVRQLRGKASVATALRSKGSFSFSVV